MNLSDIFFSNPQANLGNGAPAKLFSSASPRVVNTHFRWMANKGLDGVALQRFVVTLSSTSVLIFIPY